MKSCELIFFIGLHTVSQLLHYWLLFLLPISPLDRCLFVYFCVKEFMLIESVCGKVIFNRLINNLLTPFHIELNRLIKVHCEKKIKFCSVEYFESISVNLTNNASLSSLTTFFILNLYSLYSVSHSKRGPISI